MVILFLARIKVVFKRVTSVVIFRKRNISSKIRRDFESLGEVTVGTRYVTVMNHEFKVGTRASNSRNLRR